MFSTHVVHPLGEALHRGLEQHPGELDDVEHSLQNVVWWDVGKRSYIYRTLLVKATYNQSFQTKVVIIPVYSTEEVIIPV